MNNLNDARQVLAAAKETEAADRPGFQLVEGQVEQALGQEQAAATTYKQLMLGHPLSAEAQTARAKLTQMGAEATLTVSDLHTLADAYYNAGRYSEADEQFRVLARAPGLDAQARDGFAVAEAACQLKLKRLTAAEARALPDTADENGARRLDLLMELARDKDDAATQKQIVAEMETRFPRSSWLADALFSSGNMYLLKRDYSDGDPVLRRFGRAFPRRQERRGRALARRLAELPVGAIRRRGAHFRRADPALSRGHRNSLGAVLARTPLRDAGSESRTGRGQLPHHHPRLPALLLRADGAAAAGRAGRRRSPRRNRNWTGFSPCRQPQLVDTFPEDSPHLAKARLLANAGLNEYIAQEIKADPNSSSWSGLAEAQIYSSYGETFRAVRAIKRALPNAASASIQSIPMVYWRILFPEPWWDTIQAESARNNLDPYLVASLIRQESEFDSSAVSYANAYGLMQLLPSVGKSMAREEGIANFQTFQLLDPAMNIRLGTRYLRQMLDRFGGVQEYALAAYNAGDNRVVDWQAAGPYSGIDEFVESIPFTQTREYVEAILRNEETYRAIDDFARTHMGAGTTASR